MLWKGHFDIFVKLQNDKDHSVLPRYFIRGSKIFKVGLTKMSKIGFRFFTANSNLIHILIVLGFDNFVKTQLL